MTLITYEPWAYELCALWCNHVILKGWEIAGRDFSPLRVNHFKHIRVTMLKRYHKCTIWHVDAMSNLFIGECLTSLIDFSVCNQMFSHLRYSSTLSKWWCKYIQYSWHEKNNLKRFQAPICHDCLCDHSELLVYKYPKCKNTYSSVKHILKCKKHIPKCKNTYPSVKTHTLSMNPQKSLFPIRMSRLRCYCQHKHV